MTSFNAIFEAGIFVKYLSNSGQMLYLKPRLTHRS